MEMTPWGKLVRYAHLHEVNPDKYPAGRVPVEFSTFISDIKDLMDGFFGVDGVMARLFIFFFNNPVLIFMIAFGLAFGSFELAKHALKVSKM